MISFNYSQSVIVFLRDINRNLNGAVHEAAALLEFSYANDSAAILCVQWLDVLYENKAYVPVRLLMYKNT